jgi:hypothetical protein
MTALPGDPMVAFVDQVFNLSATRIISYVTISTLNIIQKARPFLKSQQ